MEKIIVSKFGGTSMGDAACMLRSAEVSVKQKSRLIVVSATSGTTNQLIELGSQAQSQKQAEVERLLLGIRERHFQIAKDLKASTQTHEFLQSVLDELDSLARGIFLLRDCSPKALDNLMSFGERLSSLLFVEAMKHKTSSVVEWLDARQVIRTDEQFGKAKPDLQTIEILAKEKLIPSLKSGVIFVTQGFIGSTIEGFTTTLGRGGSDYSAALFAEAVKADVLEIWTDVPGIATTDPRLCAKARPLKEISFKEASELATFGAKVLHPATLLPAIRKNIPTFVGSSFESEQRGTWVLKEVRDYPLIRAMALRKKQALVTLSTPEMLQAHGFLYQIFKIFNDHKVSIDAITTSEISVSMTLDDVILQNKKLLQDLSTMAELQVEEGLCLVSLIGNNINHTPGLSKKLFESIPDINVRMICLGASKHNFCFLVSEQQGPLVIQRLHEKFIEESDYGR